MTLAKFIGAQDYSTWLHFNGYQRRLYVVGSSRASIPITAWSGGGQTNRLNLDRRTDMQAKHKSAVPTDESPLNPYQGSSDSNKVSVVDHKGKSKEVAKIRGGVLPPGEWVAVAKSAPEYRMPNTGLGDILWWLYPHRLNDFYKGSERDLNTFYIHIAGYLGSDGCIVMDYDNLVLLTAKLKGRSYTFLRSAVYEGGELGTGRNVSNIA
ncbi:hypothetical protein [Azospirillum argentinense]|uniref:hypothetical protein n=1 Tax=Azospirillum argentinense TaxID=2970906 RepID=UPI001184B08F|nr:hypothetical protein [Azospirillum argentinense]